MSAPLSGDVHVNVPGQEKKPKLKHDVSNLKELRDSFNRFLDEEADEAMQPNDIMAKWMEKAKLDTDAREHIADDNFAMPKERKYPIEDMDHAKNALARSSGKPEEEQVRAAVYRKYPSLKPVEKDEPTDPGEESDQLDPDTNPSMMWRLNNWDAEVMKDYGMSPMQDLIDGMDWEMASNQSNDESMAELAAEENLKQDPDHYRKLRYNRDRTDNKLEKDEDYEDMDNSPGYSIDLGSGNSREPGHMGLDLYPYNHGTIVHDLNGGIPFPDGSCNSVIVRNSLEQMEDPESLLEEIDRVLMPGGTLSYEGPNDLREWAENNSGLDLVSHEDNDDDSGIEKQETPIVRQVYQKIDPATADDAEPDVSDPVVPEDTLLAANALDEVWNSYGDQANGMRGYSKAQKGERSKIAQIKKAIIGVFASFSNDAAADKAPTEVANKSRFAKVLKADKAKQIVYGVVLSPDEVDSQDDWMSSDDIEKAAHDYMAASRVIGAEHSRPMDATPVESYIAPQDLNVDGQNGPQVVKKGSWILGVKVIDPDEWEKVMSGDYTGFSVGGYGERK